MSNRGSSWGGTDDKDRLGGNRSGRKNGKGVAVCGVVGDQITQRMVLEEEQWKGR